MGPYDSLSPGDIEDMYSWGDAYFDDEGELVEDPKRSKVADTASIANQSQTPLVTGKYGTDSGDLTTEAINSGQMTDEDRRLLTKDLEAVEKGSSTESIG